MELCERIVDGETVAGLRAGIKKNLVPFVKAVRELRVHAKKVRRKQRSHVPLSLC
jgi:hypothetical protein